ncbi:unnamed protein product [Parajaminaea phylloscopi]
MPPGAPSHGQGNASHPKNKGSLPQGSSVRLAVDSHFQFDPLLRSTFGHRSIDLYGSDLYDEADGSSLEIAQGQQASGGSASASGSAVGTHGVGSNSLLNASRYGLRGLGRSNVGDLPDIEDEPYEDDDEQRAADEEEAHGERWARGVHLQQLQHRADDEYMDGSDDLDRRDDTPNASYLASNRQMHDSRGRSNNALSTGLDPFLVDDEPEEHSARSRQYTTDSEQDGEQTTDPGSASDSIASSVPASRIEQQRHLTPQRERAAVDKGKGRALDAARPQPLPNGGRGWLAHSTAARKGSLRHTSRPLRDAYSIYDDDDDDDDGMFQDDDSDAAASEDTEDDDRSDAESASRRHRTAKRNGPTSSIHRPVKLSASTFPDHSAMLDNAPRASNFHTKLDSRSQTPHGTPSAGMDTSRLDVYTYPTAVGSSLASWKPWVRGNNPSWREWKDSGALAVWATAIAITFLLAGGASIGVSSPRAPSSPAIRPSPYYTLTRSLPLLIVLSCLSLGLAVLQLAFLRNLNRLGGARILRWTLLSIPATLTLVWVWAFAGSFLFEDEQWSGGSWSTLGLRGLSLIPLLLALVFSRVLYVKRNGIARSLSVLTLSAEIITAHPTLLLLSFLHIVVFLVISGPFMTIFVRLFLLGHFSNVKLPTGDGQETKSKEWITDERARLLAWATLATWLWTWAALRGIMRVVVSSVVSHWYFYGPPSQEPERRSDEEPALRQGGKKLRRGDRADFDDHDDDDDEGIGGDSDEDEETGISGLAATLPGGFQTDDDGCGGEHEDAQLEHRNPTASDLVRASFLRATGPSLGTILLSALLLALSRALLIISWVSRTIAALLSSPQVPTFLHPLAHLAYLLSGAGGVIKGVSDYTLIYTGITGQGFWVSSRRCSRILVKRGAQGVMEGLIIGTILSLLTVSLSLLAALAGFLFSAHQLHVPADAPLVGLLCGIVPYWTLRLAADVLSNGADALYLCYAIDEGGSKAATGNAREADTQAASDPTSAARPKDKVPGMARGQAEGDAPAGSEEARRAFQTRSDRKWGDLLPF